MIGLYQGTAFSRAADLDQKCLGFSPWGRRHPAPYCFTYLNENFGVKPTDTATLAPIAAVLLLAGLAACWVPARRALRVDPVSALRQE